MFRQVMVPVDLTHIEKLGRALDCAADLARLYGLPVAYVGVTSSAPSSLAHNPEEFGRKLQAFAQTQAEKHGVVASAHLEIAHDPTIDVDDALIRSIDKTGADVVVMATHLPGAIEYIWPSNGGKLAGHAKCSVMLVRP